MNRNSNQMRYEPRLYVYIRAVRVGGEKKKERRKEKKKEKKEGHGMSRIDWIERKPGEKYNDAISRLNPFKP